MTIERQGGYYPVEGKKVPDAWLVQEEANDKKIRTQVIFSEQTDDYAKVIVRAIAPNGWYVEDTVIHHFNTILQKKALEYLVKDSTRANKGEKPKIFQDVDNPFDEAGRPILSKNGQLILLNAMMRFKAIAIRDAESKAARRAQLKAMNSDWRDEGELKEELDEVKMVQADIKERKTGVPPVELPEAEDEWEDKYGYNKTSEEQYTPEERKALDEERKKPKKNFVDLTPSDEPKKPKLQMKGKLTVTHADIPEDTKKPDYGTPSKELDEQLAKTTIKSVYLEADGKEVKKPDNLAKETVLGPEATEQEIEQAAEEIRQQLVAERENERVNELRDKKELTHREQTELAELQAKLRQEGLKQAVDNLSQNPHLPDFSKAKVRRPEGFKEIKGS